ncbi:type II toxin-antitoxin system RelE/ParE family toxin [Pedobacter sp. 22163]|uniref:type II toxin-antitoxin system RelE/ParE family toxin n=1 Tax=Pedobacter sp. 22163 TaxID=3453883 RepID=UPI003F854D63
MSLPIFWTDEAKETFDAIFFFILDKFSEQSAKKFLKQANKILKIIKVQPEIFEASIYDQCRKGRITNQTSVFYEIQNDQIRLLFFFDNRQDPLIT